MTPRVTRPAHRQPRLVNRTDEVTRPKGLAFSTPQAHLIASESLFDRSDAVNNSYTAALASYPRLWRIGLTASYAIATIQFGKKCCGIDSSQIHKPNLQHVT